MNDFEIGRSGGLSVLLYREFRTLLRGRVGGTKDEGRQGEAGWTGQEDLCCEGSFAVTRYCLSEKVQYVTNF